MQLLVERMNTVEPAQIHIFSMCTGCTPVHGNKSLFLTINTIRLRMRSRMLPSSRVILFNVIRTFQLGDVNYKCGTPRDQIEVHVICQIHGRPSLIWEGGYAVGRILLTIQVKEGQLKLLTYLNFKRFLEITAGESSESASKD